MKIFLSYGHDKNAGFVEEIKKALEKRHPDFQIWFDKQNIHAGDEWRNEIYKGISGSDAVLACLSKHSVRVPGVCLDELRIAAGERTCQIASLLLESPEEVQPPLSISHIQYLDLSMWEQKKAEGKKEYQRWFERQIDVISDILIKNKDFPAKLKN